jgi:hypothetical protein
MLTPLWVYDYFPQEVIENVQCHVINKTIYEFNHQIPTLKQVALLSYKNLTRLLDFNNINWDKVNTIDCHISSRNPHYLHLGYKIVKKYTYFDYFYFYIGYYLLITISLVLFLLRTC